MRTSIAALVGGSAMLALLAGGAPAQAQVWFEYRTWSTPRYYDEPPPRVLAPAPLPRSAIRSIVGERGFEVIGPIARRGEVYFVPVEDMRGRRARLVVDAFDGEILDRLAAAGPPRPPAEIERGHRDFGPPSSRGRLARPGLPADPPSPPPRPSDLAALPAQPAPEASRPETTAPSAAKPEPSISEEAAAPAQDATPAQDSPAAPEAPREAAAPAPAEEPKTPEASPPVEAAPESGAPVAQAPSAPSPVVPESRTPDAGEGKDGDETSEPQRRQPRVVYPGLHTPQQGE